MIPSVQIIRADARQLPLTDASMDCIVTSPPYWGLRDYKADGQIGLERTPEEYVAQIVACFRECWRVLKPQGTAWLNLGPSYLGGIPGSGGATAKQATNRGSLFSGKRPIQSLADAPAYGTNGKELRDSMVADSSCSYLCDECLDDFVSHHESTAGTSRQSERSEQQPLRKDHDNVPMDSVSASQAALPPAVQESTILRSWRQHRGECSRCDKRAAYLSGLGSSSFGALASSGMSWVNYSTRLKPKDMVPIPWMVAMALQADGWWLRSDIIWAKPNPMPESVTDRPTKAHEYLFLLVKGERYYYDAAAIAEPAMWPGGPNAPDKIKSPFGQGFTRKADKQRGHGRRHADFNERWGAMSKEQQCSGMRNKRSVWSIPTIPYPEAHFATFPPALVRPCILAGCPVGGTVLDPFGGTGTVGQVALDLHRNAVIVDLKYQELADKRLAVTQPGLAL